MRVLIIIITYNEIENIGKLIPEVFNIISHNVDILVVDDSSPDGTGKVVENLSSEYPNRLFLYTRPVKEGTAAAYTAGFKWGLSRDYDAFLQFDGDFSHNPIYIPKMLEEIKTHDVVIGSRYIKGGGIEDWTLSRKIISRWGSVYSQIVLSCPIKDFTGGFNIFNRSALEKIGLDGIISKSYSLQVELKYKAFCSGCSIKEVPIIFTDRKHGTSKISNNTLIEALFIMWKIKKNVGIDSGFDQFLKFALTGGLGTITNLLIFFLCVDIFNFKPIPISILCFFIAGTQNYIINHKWSFKQNILSESLSFKKWGLFLCGSLLGYIINISIMQLMILHLELPIKTIAQACGILGGLIINFIISKLIVFRKKKK
ncbi:MAG: glycosyltransferase family 2 protein [Treponema sp.]|nr:glycosyltransferase family 2 protein [Treponema sp.]